MVSLNWLNIFPAIQTQLDWKQSEPLEVGLEASQVPLDNRVLHCHQTEQKTGWKEPDSALPSLVCPKLQAWVVPGSCRKEQNAWGAKKPSMSTRTPSTLTFVGERLEDDESSFKATVLKGPAEPLGALLEEVAEPLDAILWGLAESIEAI